MDRKRKMHRIISIGLIVIFLVFINYNVFNNIMSEPEFQELVNSGNINTIDKSELIVPILLMYFFSIITYLFSPFGIFTFCYIAYRIAVAVTIRKNRKHPKFDVEYFRDYLNKISPAYVSYLIDYRTEVDRDVPAHLLKLQLDGYILENNGTFTVSQKDKTNLNNSDMILLDFVESNFQNKGLLVSYKNAIAVEMLKHKYLKQTFNIMQFKNLGLMFFLPQFCLFFLPFLSVAFFDSNPAIVIFIVVVLGLILPILTFAAPVIIVIKIILYFRYGSIKRTEKGNELLGQIYGLKNFLEDFTNIDDSTLKEAYLREHYLVYAIVLGINDLVTNTMLDKIKLQMNKNS